MKYLKNKAWKLKFINEAYSLPLLVLEPNDVIVHSATCDAKLVAIEIHLVVRQQYTASMNKIFIVLKTLIICYLSSLT